MKWKLTTCGKSLFDVIKHMSLRFKESTDKVSTYIYVWNVFNFSSIFITQTHFCDCRDKLVLLRDGEAVKYHTV